VVTEDNMPQYLDKFIEGVRRTDIPRYGMCVDGYTKQSGAPTCFLLKLEGEKIWRRLMVWCFSNSGTHFLRIKGIEYLMTDTQLHVVMYDLLKKDTK